MNTINRTDRKMLFRNYAISCRFEYCSTTTFLVKIIQYFKYLGTYYSKLKKGKIAKLDLN